MASNGKRTYEAAVETETMTYHERVNHLPLGDKVYNITKDSLNATTGNNLWDKIHTLLGGEGRSSPRSCRASSATCSRATSWSPSCATTVTWIWMGCPVS